MKRRVLMLVENLSVPYDRRVWNESRALAQGGYDVTVICPQGDGRESASYEEIHGIHIHRYPPRWSRGGTAGYVAEYGVALWRTFRLALRLGWRERFDVVHAANPPDLLFLVALPLRLRRSRFVFDQHDLGPELVAIHSGAPIVRRISALAERVSYAVADLVISPNETYRRIAIERGKARLELTTVVRNGPDLSILHPVEPDPALKRGKQHLVCYVGVMGRQDGVEYALRALARLREKGRTDVHAAFLGDGDAQSACISLASELGLGSCVEFTGRVGDEEIRCYLSSADIGLAPEPKTPLNDASTMIKVMEYMALGVPIVAFDLAETRFSAADAAAYAEPNDESHFAQLISDLLDDPSRRRRMAEAGRRRVREALSWEHSREALLAAYDRIFTLGEVT